MVKRSDFTEKVKSKTVTVALRKFWCLHSLAWQINHHPCYQLFFPFHLAPDIIPWLLKVLQNFYLAVIWRHMQTKLPLFLKHLFVFWRMSHDSSQNALMWSHERGSDPQNVNYSHGWRSYLWAETALGRPCWVWGWTGTVCLVGDTGPAAAPLDSLWELMDPSLLLHHRFHRPECGSSWCWRETRGLNGKSRSRG